MAAAALLVGLLGAMELTPENFDKEVFESGKSGFIKFLAPCDKVIVADVDCTAAGEPLCSRFGVQGFPTIKVFNPPDTDGEDYEGGRDEDSLIAFAAELGPGCSVDTLENCSAEQKAELQDAMKLTQAERDAQIKEMQDMLTKLEEDHDALLKSLQAQYDESNKNVEEKKKEFKPKIKLLKKASPKPAAAADSGKDEV